jgi:hypothetical protein
MQLPNAQFAAVSHEKIVDYLLNPEHPDGWSTAKFFCSLGFTITQWQALATALRTVAADYPIKRTMESNHGCKYIIEGVITSPGGALATVRTVWIIDKEQVIPRLVTAYPCEPL